MGVVGVITDGYKPSEDEAFMNERQKEYFRRKLLAWRESILAESRETLAALQSESENHPDIACLLYTSPSPRDRQTSRMPSSA